MNDNLKNNLIEEFKNRFPSNKFVPGESPVPISGKVFDEKEMLKIEKRLKGENYSDYFKQDGGKFTLKNTHPHSFVSLRQRNMFNYEFKKSLDRINVNINELLDTLSSIVIISNSRYLEFELDKTDVYVFFENDKLKILGYKKETSI